MEWKSKAEIRSELEQSESYQALTVEQQEATVDACFQIMRVEYDAPSYRDWLANLERKVTDADVEKDLHLAEYVAHSYLDEYEGTFGFMLQMQSARLRRQLRPAQVRGVLNCLRAELQRSARQAVELPESELQTGDELYSQVGI